MNRIKKYFYYCIILLCYIGIFSLFEFGIYQVFVYFVHNISNSLSIFIFSMAIPPFIVGDNFTYILKSFDNKEYIYKVLMFLLIGFSIGFLLSISFIFLGFDCIILYILVHIITFILFLMYFCMTGKDKREYIEKNIDKNIN